MIKDVIKLEEISVSFNIMEEKVTSLKEFFVKIFRRRIKYEIFFALKNISFTIKKGEVIGVLGLNGAGKSTLLKIISGVLKPTSGKIEVNGKIAPLIELGAGFDPELTGRENIYLNGSLLGFSRKNLKNRIDEIIEFSELKEFIDMPLKNYSSGMYTRLGFSIAILYEPDILIIDEVLSVGDFHFQEKSLNKIHEMIKKNTTVLFVSHDINQVKEICDKVLWISKGELIEYGDTKLICEKYLKI